MKVIAEPDPGEERGGKGFRDVRTPFPKSILPPQAILLCGVLNLYINVFFL